MTKPRTQKIHFLLLFFEHQYLAYYDRFTADIFDTYSQHSDLVNCVPDFFLKRSSFCFIKSRKII